MNIKLSNVLSDPLVQITFNETTFTGESDENLVVLDEFNISEVYSVSGRYESPSPVLHVSLSVTPGGEDTELEQGVNSSASLDDNCNHIGGTDDASIQFGKKHKYVITYLATFAEGQHKASVTVKFKGKCNIMCDMNGSFLK